MQDIEAIERATLDAVPPRRLVQWGDWLLALDDGTVGRCHSAVPLAHGGASPGVLPELERRYREAGLPLVLRVPELAAFTPLHEALRAQGYARGKPTLVQTGELAALLAARPAEGELAIEVAPGGEWEQVFLGEGFDPVDGASRLAILRRGRDSLFASVRVQGRTVAVGSACTSHGWCGVHGMRTLPAWRGRGFAGAILAALAQAALARGVQRCFLQVEAANANAQALYARRGFATAWAYAYWQRAR
ncbi:GNAT family N-acetyltransferase [Ramlibacter sp. USB13]|uniref:GNAT family N-acetyltransferase n=1 Tax=Ramlibacter cellulosilyticus TaxID=2764187 RepID=A0A923MQ83_9BURK|nr:GNAT family N-acetyltransferase [Ramlibacter cellulosilyticus]MBC5783812.1 GNAT family N-acetyltransferase [Ramlibacter cellulosilyticus]